MIALNIFKTKIYLKKGLSLFFNFILNNMGTGKMESREGQDFRTEVPIAAF